MNLGDMFAEVGKERTFPTKGRHLRKNCKAEVAPLELAFAKITPLSEGNGPSVMRKHRQRVTVDEILGEYIGRGQTKLIRFIQIQVVGKDLKHVRVALSDIVRQEFNPVSAHNRQQGVLSPLELGFSKLYLYGGQFTLQDWDKEIPASARRLQETRVNALGLALYQVKHLFDQPLRRKHLSVVCNAPFGLDQIHR
jgi:hypothetical protein